MAPSCTQQQRAARRRVRRGGFTLIETALTVTIVGVAIVAMCQLLAAGTVANVDSAELTTGMTLARNVRELSLRLAFTDPTTPTKWGIDAGESASNPATYDDVNDMADQTFSPPINSSGQALSGFNDWSQSIKVVPVDPNRLTLTTPGSLQPANLVTVTISHRNTKVCDLTWYVFDGTP